MPDPPSKLPLIDPAKRNRLAGRIEAAIARVLAHGCFILGPPLPVAEALARQGCQRADACLPGAARSGADQRDDFFALGRERGLIPQDAATKYLQPPERTI